MSRPFINRDLFSIGIPRHSPRQSCARDSLQRAEWERLRVRGKPVQCHRCQYSCSLLTIRLLWTRWNEIGDDKTLTLIPTLHLILEICNCGPFRGIQFFMKALLVWSEDGLWEMRRLVLSRHSIHIPIYLKRDIQQAVLCFLCAGGPFQWHQAILWYSFLSEASGSVGFQEKAAVRSTLAC